jgi:hypothetical protein
MYERLRALATEADLVSIKPETGEPLWGVAVAMMEIGLETGVASFVAMADGTVSMYTSTGGGVIGGGDHAAVRAAARRFRGAMADSRRLLESSSEFPLPEAGTVRFHARTVDGNWTGVAAEEALRTGRHPLAELYAAGQDLVTELRLSTPG